MCLNQYQQELGQRKLPTLWTIPDVMWLCVQQLLPPEKEPGTEGRPAHGVGRRRVATYTLFRRRTESEKYVVLSVRRRCEPKSICVAKMYGAVLSDAGRSRADRVAFWQKRLAKTTRVEA